MIRIAIVEDDRVYAGTLQEYLCRYEKESGEMIQSTLFEDGEDIAVGYRAEYDIILMDIEMPVMDGYEATMMIRKLPNRIRANIPIIALTANSVPENRERARMVGMDEFLAKPANSARIIRSLAKFQ